MSRVVKVLVVVLVSILVLPVVVLGSTLYSSYSVGDGSWGVPQIHYVKGDIYQLELEWTADSTSSADITFSGVGWALMGYAIETKPVSVSTAYTVDVYDENDWDVLGGQGASRSTSAVERIYVDYTPVLGTCKIDITGSSDGDKGKIILFIQKL